MLTTAPRQQTVHEYYLRYSCGCRKLRE